MNRNGLCLILLCQPGIETASVWTKIRYQRKPAIADQLTVCKGRRLARFRMDRQADAAKEHKEDNHENKETIRFAV